MKDEIVSLVMSAMKLLESNSLRVEYLYQVACGGRSGMDYESFLAIEKKMAEEFFKGHSGDFAKMLKAYWEPRTALQGGHLSGLGHSMLHFLDDVLADLPDDQLNEVVLSLFYDYVVFFTTMMISSSSMGSANKLLRTFGEQCEAACCSDYFIQKMRDAEFKEVHQIRDSLAEGIIKRRGAWEVLRNYSPAQ